MDQGLFVRRTSPVWRFIRTVVKPSIQLEAQLLPLVGSGHRDLTVPQGLQRQCDRLAAVHDRRLNVWSREGEGDQLSQIAVVDADDVTPGCCVRRCRVDPGLGEFGMGAAESRDQDPIRSATRRARSGRLQPSPARSMLEHDWHVERDRTIRRDGRQRRDGPSGRFDRQADGDPLGMDLAPGDQRTQLRLGCGGLADQIAQGLGD